MKSLKIIITLLLICLPVLMWGCGEDKDDGYMPEVPECDCQFDQLTEENGIHFIFEQMQVKKPANVSVLFKVTTSEGVPLPSLTSEDFKLYEDDSYISVYESRQTILPKPGTFKSHTILLLDLSGSILNSDSLMVVKQAAKQFVTAVIPESDTDNFGRIDIGIWWFDGAEHIHSLVPFSTDTDALLSGIEEISPDISSDSSTNLYGAIIEGVQKAKSVTGTTQNSVEVASVVIFTDGRDQAARMKHEDAVKSVSDANQNTSIYTIGLGGEIDVNELTVFGRDGFVLAENIDDIVPKFEEIAARITDDVNSHYLLEYCSPKRQGSHTLKIYLNLDGVTGSLISCFCADGFEGGCTIGQ